MTKKEYEDLKVGTKVYESKPWSVEVVVHVVKLKAQNKNENHEWLVVSDEEGLVYRDIDKEYVLKYFYLSEANAIGFIGDELCVISDMLEKKQREDNNKMMESFKKIDTMMKEFAKRSQKNKKEKKDE